MLLSSITIFCLSLTPPLEQSQLIVNGKNALPGEYVTIREAVDASFSGDEILIKGITHNGTAIGYSEQQYLTGILGEVFPITIDHALTLKPYDPGKPVLV